MSPRVIALVVVHTGSGRTGEEHLSRTLSALQDQTRRPDQLIVVATGTPDAVVRVAEGFSPTQLITATETLPYASAVALAMRSIPSLTDEDLLWFLAQDTVPERDALRVLAGALETQPSVSIAAPKVLNGQDPTMIASFGQSVTRFGARVDLVSDEMDQGQHDDAADVLGAQATGLLVRASTFRGIGGFDPSLVNFDGGLDLSIRARLAGRRVVLAGGAEIRDYGDGVIGPKRDGRASTRRRNVRLARFAQLHRRLTYAPAWTIWLHWLSLLPVALLRTIVALVRKRPETIAAELGAAVQAAFSRQRLGESRRKIARSRVVHWSALAPLRISFREVRTRRRLQAEENAPASVSERGPLRFFDGGGAWLVLFSAVVGVLLIVPLLGGGYLAGANLMQLSDTVQDLWRNAGFGWRDISVGLTGAADPFAVVLAALGSLTFWEPSTAVVVVMVAALPLATLGGWFAMVRFTERATVRIAGSVLWTLAPAFVVALVDGRFHAVLVHILLPWLFYAATAVRRSWSAAGAASILAAVIAAAAPSTIPALLVAWVILLATSGRSWARVFWTLVPSLVLFAPLVWSQGVQRGSWISVFADPGAPTRNPSAEPVQLLLGIPDPTSLGVARAFDFVGAPGFVATITVGALLLPVAVAAVGALFSRRSLLAAALLVISGVSCVSAGLAATLQIGVAGTALSPVWTGSLLSVYWFGLIAAAAIGIDSVQRASTVVAIVAAAAVTIVAIPALVSVPTERALLTVNDGRGLPMYVSAAAQDDPDVRSLVLRPRGDNSLSAVLVRGSGVTLDRQSTIVSTSLNVTEREQELAEVAANLAVSSGADTSAALEEFGIRFVVVSRIAIDEGVNPAAVETQATQIAATLDANPALNPVGDTDRGTLWQTSEPTDSLAIPTTAEPQRALIFAVTGLVFLAALLLSVPTAASRRSADLHPRTLGGVRSFESIVSTSRARRRDRAARRSRSNGPADRGGTAASWRTRTLATTPDASARSDAEGGPESNEPKVVADAIDGIGDGGAGVAAVATAPVSEPTSDDGPPSTHAPLKVSAPTNASADADEAASSPELVEPADPEADAHAVVRGSEHREGDTRSALGASAAENSHEGDEK